jgi:creatinine amidohydrolase/Fe(II)-dependent formamide hydrolase-like protein
MVCGDLFDKYGSICFFNQWWEVLPSLKAEWNCEDHGGYFETSMMMGVNESLVDLGQAKAAPVNPLSGEIVYEHGWHYRGAPIPIPVGIEKVHKYGNVGNPPFGANAALGRQMIDAYVEFNVGLVGEMRKMGAFGKLVEAEGKKDQR